MPLVARCPSAEHVWDPLVAVRMPIWILGLDERLLLSIRAVSSTERLSLITSNIISHKEFQATSRASETRQRHIKWGLAREPKQAGRLGASHAENCDFSEKKKKKCKTVWVWSSWMRGDERIRMYHCKITLSLTAPINTAKVSLLWFMMHNTSSEPWFWYDWAIPCDGADQRLDFLPVWYFNVKTICWEALFHRSCRLTTHQNNYGPTMVFAADEPLL